MRSNISIDTAHPEALKRSLSPSLERDGIRVTKSDALEIEATSDEIGSMRGITDNIFRLTTLAHRIIEE